MYLENREPKERPVELTRPKTKRPTLDPEGRSIATLERYALSPDILVLAALPLGIRRSGDQAVGSLPGTVEIHIADLHQPPPGSAREVRASRR
jgi:hypothetical protein